jgi:hypothetical protein
VKSRSSGTWSSDNSRDGLVAAFRSRSSSAHLGAAGQNQRELDASRGKHRVDITEDPGARRIDFGDAPQFQQQGDCSLGGLAIDDLGKPLGAAEEQRAL